MLPAPLMALFALDFLACLFCLAVVVQFSSQFLKLLEMEVYCKGLSQVFYSRKSQSLLNTFTENLRESLKVAVAVAHHNTIGQCSNTLSLESFVL